MTNIHCCCVILLSSVFYCSLSFSKPVNSPHVHGTSNLNIALDKNVLQMNFIAPLMDIAGFETTPSTEAEINTMQNILALFRKPENTLSILGGSCKVKKVEVNDELILTSSKLKHSQINQTSHEHEHEHEHEHDRKNKIHSELNSQYEFFCAEINDVIKIKMLIFDVFPSIKKINVQWVSNTGQGQLTLSKKENEFRLK